MRSDKALLQDALLMDAAKAVIEWWRNPDPSDLPIEQLIAAVERADSDEEIDRINQEAMNIYMSGVLAERERIKKILGERVRGELLEKIDESDSI